MTLTNSDTLQLLSELLPWLEEHAAVLLKESKKSRGTSSSVSRSNLIQDIARVRALMCQLESIQAAPSFKDVEKYTAEMPGLFLECPFARDTDAAAAAPTIPMSMFKRIFGDFLKDPVSGGLIFNVIDNARPQCPWCSSFDLSSNVEERGQLLTFVIEGEKDVRIAWVRS